MKKNFNIRSLTQQQQQRAAWPMTVLTRLNYVLLYGFFHSFVCPTATHLPLQQESRIESSFLFFVCRLVGRSVGCMVDCVSHKIEYVIQEYFPYIIMSDVQSSVQFNQTQLFIYIVRDINLNILIFFRHMATCRISEKMHLAWFL